MKHGKKYNAAAAKYDLTKKYDVASSDKSTREAGIKFLSDIMKKMDRLDSRSIVAVMYTYTK